MKEMPSDLCRFRVLRNFLLVVLCSVSLGSISAWADVEKIDTWIREMDHPDPFVSARGESELRNLGDEALIPLASRWQAWMAPGASVDPLQQLRVETLLDTLLASFLSQLESDYRALELDRRELADLREQQDALEELRRLRQDVPKWEREVSGLRDKVETFRQWAELDRAKERNPKLPAEELERLSSLEKQVESLRQVVPKFDEKAKSYLRWRDLESIAGRLESVAEAAKLRVADLETRTKEGAPRVESLKDQLHSIGLLAYSALFSRQEFLPLAERPREGPGGVIDARPFLAVFFDELLAGAVERVKKTGALSPPENVFEKIRYRLAPLLVFEIEQKGSDAGAAAALLSKHLEKLVAELDHENSKLRHRAAVELFRMRNRGARVVDTEKHPFLASLLRWRVHPDVHRRTGLHFSDFEELPFATRRRRVFQFARAAGRDALPTLRAMIADDKLESSFLVKYAAARALASTAIRDRAGIVLLQTRHPEMTLKRPEISRDLHLLQGLAHVRSKDYSAAVREFRKILDEYPFDFRANYHLAFSYLLLKDYPRSIHHFEIARRIQPNDQLTLYNLACAYSLGGLHDKAVDALEASIDAGFDDPVHIENDSDLDPIRSHDRYPRALEKCRAKAAETEGNP